MTNSINFNKAVFNKTQYEKTINTSFTELGVQPIEEQISTQPTIQEFFTMYNELFYEIPETGEINSHEYLILTSGEYIGSEEESEEIQALQNEIFTLREELLEAQNEIVNITVKNIK
tara:strand:+ start:189 stop:539 length:351 start_codon:yes stop_codon:yes gene_type:complete